MITYKIFFYASECNFYISIACFNCIELHIKSKDYTSYKRSYPVQSTIMKHSPARVPKKEIQNKQ